MKGDCVSTYIMHKCTLFMCGIIRPILNIPDILSTRKPMCRNSDYEHVHCKEPSRQLANSSCGTGTEPRGCDYHYALQTWTCCTTRPSPRCLSWENLTYFTADGNSDARLTRQLWKPSGLRYYCDFRSSLHLTWLSLRVLSPQLITKF